jgi:hypothetical protein
MASLLTPTRSPQRLSSKERQAVRTPSQEANVASGLILLLLIGVLVGFGITRMRRRLGLGVTGGTWVAVITGVIVLGLALWAYSVSGKH